MNQANPNGRQGQANTASGPQQPPQAQHAGNFPQQAPQPQAQPPLPNGPAPAGGILPLQQFQPLVSKHPIGRPPKEDRWLPGNLLNTTNALTNLIQKGYVRLAYNLLTNNAEIMLGSGAWALFTNHEATLLTLQLQRDEHVNARSATVLEAAVAHARAHSSYHPIQQWLNSLRWDGIPRLDSWLIDTFGCADTPLIRAQSAKWLVTAAKRVFEPGCQSDYALVLQGHQGGNKTRVLKALAYLPAWYVGFHAKVSTKAASEDLQGKWIVELEEMSSLGKVATEAVKAFISRTTDRYRPSYGHVSLDHPRQCIIAGTTNNPQPLKDPTGDRRFWVIHCPRTGDLNYIEQIRGQLWAEALYRVYQKKEPLELDPGLEAQAREAQEEFRKPHPWEQPVGDFLRNRPWVWRVTVHTILADCIGKEVKELRGWDQTLAAQVLSKLGWIQKKIPDNPAVPGQRSNYYVAPVGGGAARAGPRLAPAHRARRPQPRRVPASHPRHAPGRSPGHAPGVRAPSDR